MKKIFLSLLVISLFLIACKDASKSAYPSSNLDFVAPSGAGGGWDLTIRTVAKVLKDTKLVKVAMPVRNAPGAGGAVHLANLQNKSKDDKTISVYSPPLLLINLNGTTKYSYKDTTPLARLIADYGVFVVKSDSPFKSIKDVMEALKKDPKSVKIGGTSSLGSMDHIQFLVVAKAAGVEKLDEIDYVSFDDDGATQVLGGHIDLFSTSLGDVLGLLQSGDLRALAQTGPKRIEGPLKASIPTCIEEGINVSFVNWRGIFGPPKMPQYAVNFWQETFLKMVKTPAWKEALKKNGWEDAYLDKAAFEDFLAKTEKSYEEILKEIGMFKKK